MDKMLAAVLQRPNNIKIEYVRLFDIDPNEVSVKDVHCSVCHTDITYWEGKVQVKTPLILGHEISGVIENIGENVKNVRHGDHVVLPPVYGCELCSYCKDGDDNLCDNYTMFGFNRPGGFAERVTLPAKYAFKIPDDMPLEHAAPIADAISTPYHALTVSIPERNKIKPGDNVAIFGLGGLGSATTLLANVWGANVIAVDIRDEALEMAKDLGAKTVINPRKIDMPVSKYIRKMTGGVNLAIECIGRKDTNEEAYASLRKGGRAIDIGFIPDKPTEGKPERVYVNLWGASLMGKSLGLEGTFGCRTSNFPLLIKLIEEKNIPIGKLVSKTFSLSGMEDDGMNVLFKEIERGEYTGRVVIKP